MPVVRVLGVFDDGTPRSSEVPENPRVSIRVTQGGSVRVELTVVNPAGQLQDLSQATLELCVKRQITGVAGVPADLKSTATVLTEEGPGRARFFITPDQTRLLTPGIFKYDIWMVTGNEREPLIPLSPFLLEPAALLP